MLKKIIVEHATSYIYFDCKKKNVWGQKGKRKEKNAHWIDIDVQLVAIPKFHIFPKEKHAIAWPSLFWDINKWPAPILDLREFFLADLLESSTYDGDLVENGTVACIRASVPPNIVN